MSALNRPVLVGPLDMERVVEVHPSDVVAAHNAQTENPDDDAHDANRVTLWRRCPDCGCEGAHHSYTDRAGASVGTRCG